MKKIFYSLAILSIAILSTSSCDRGEGGSGNELSETQKAVLSNYVDDVVVANYVELASNGKALLTSVKAIQSSSSSDKTSLIASAADAWKTARITWERTEAYLFGPVDKAGIDPGIDSWPLVLPDLQESITEWDVNSDNYESLKADGGDLKGFHAIEYMLFSNGVAKSKTIMSFDPEYSISQGSLTDAQFEDKLESYLVAVSEELYRCVLQLEAEWCKSELSNEKKADLAAFGTNIKLNTTDGNYAEIFKTPGLDNAIYGSFEKSLEEMFVGAIGIADEVANVKISDPINAESTKPGTGLLEVESWFSFNSISDFTNNVRGIKEAFFGELAGTNTASFDISTTPAANSIGSYIGSIDSAVATKVITALNDAIVKVESMDGPFRDNLTWSTANTAARDAVAAVQSALEEAQSIIE